jgi:hypothetical protein
VTGQATSTAHAVFDLAVTKAILEGKVGDMIVRIPLMDLYDPYDGVQFDEDAMNLVLEVKISTSWVEGYTEELIDNTQNPDDAVSEPETPDTLDQNEIKSTTTKKKKKEPKSGPN